MTTLRKLARYLLAALATATIPHDLQATPGSIHSCQVAMSPTNSGDTAFIITCQPKDTTAALTVSVRGGLTNTYVVKLQGSGVTFLPVLAQDVSRATAEAREIGRDRR